MNYRQFNHSLVCSYKADIIAPNLVLTITKPDQALNIFSHKIERSMNGGSRKLIKNITTKYSGTPNNRTIKDGKVLFKDNNKYMI